MPEQKTNIMEKDIEKRTEIIIKVDRAIRFLRSIDKGNPLTLGFSGGKDSLVIYDLARESGIQFTAVHSVTTVDPPGTISFIKKYYPDVVIDRPETTFFKLIEEKGMPGRLKRFCCERLKERSGIGKYFIDGSRADESSTRIDYEPEQCDTRKWMKGCIHYYPILNWTEEDVWGYIREKNLPYSKYYDAPYNFKRHGCVGCPLSYYKQMQKELGLFPRYAKRLIKAFDRYLDTHRGTKAGKSFRDGYDMFYFYTNCRKEMSIPMFKHMIDYGFDVKRWIEETILKK